jgi:competence protein ComEA
MQLKKFANRIGFTETEFKVLFFLSIVFTTGLLIKYFQIDKTVYKNFDYRKEDSLFWASDSIDSKIVNETVNKEVKDRFKKEVLGFNDNKTYEIKKKELPVENSLNINIAGMDEIMKLPGIGEKTAIRIIEFRKANGPFKKIESLLEVKGIQSAKLEKLRKYIYVK